MACAIARRIIFPAGFQCAGDRVAGHHCSFGPRVSSKIDDDLSGRLPVMLRKVGFGRVDVIWQAFNGLLTLYHASKPD